MVPFWKRPRFIGYLVTSSRRKLTLGRQARENEIETIGVRLERIRIELLNLDDTATKIGKRRDDLIKANEEVTYYFKHKDQESVLREAAEEATAQEEEAETKLNTAIHSTTQAIDNRETKVQEFDEQLVALGQSLQESKNKCNATQLALAQKARVYDLHRIWHNKCHALGKLWKNYSQKLY